MNSADKPLIAPRTIRSFVLRTGRMTAGQARALVELWPRYGVEIGDAPLDLTALFGREAMRMIEIGFGTGDAILTFAQQHPEYDCLGIEVHRPGAGQLMMHAMSHDVHNLRVMTADAVEVMRLLPEQSIDRVHVYFPDPWHKKRHNKRRLIQTPFVNSLARILKLGGALHLATDWEDYAQQMRDVIDAHPFFINHSSSGFVDRPLDRPLTRFERRGQRLGHGVWDLAYQRAEGRSATANHVKGDE